MLFPVTTPSLTSLATIGATVGFFGFTQPQAVIAELSLTQEGISRLIEEAEFIIIDITDEQERQSSVLQLMGFDRESAENITRFFSENGKWKKFSKKYPELLEICDELSSRMTAYSIIQRHQQETAQNVFLEVWRQPRADTVKRVASIARTFLKFSLVVDEVSTRLMSLMRLNESDFETNDEMLLSVIRDVLNSARMASYAKFADILVDVAHGLLSVDKIALMDYEDMALVIVPAMMELDEIKEAVATEMKSTGGYLLRSFLLGMSRASNKKWVECITSFKEALTYLEPRNINLLPKHVTDVFVRSSAGNVSYQGMMYQILAVAHLALGEFIDAYRNAHIAIRIGGDASSQELLHLQATIVKKLSKDELLSLQREDASHEIVSDGKESSSTSPKIILGLAAAAAGLFFFRRFAQERVDDQAPHRARNRRIYRP